MSDFIIATRQLRKNYGQVEALKEIDLGVPKGSIYGFLGPNGSGKTTMIKILLGMARPTSGEVKVFGKEPLIPADGVDIRRKVGCLGRLEKCV